ncbi:hypothetical protein E0493_10115 [Roseomonas sp. M0104]|uniref:Uncharacterized protein n=1 Tax=Teichococcus coralli TaxID=2545983 RepID=A0A845B942_9PROT|nr:hypothetical protein [Pseudoroseomonas coralli]MXP63701.1 hypothetical protein [Pseudoroseomonas coralli]
MTDWANLERLREKLLWSARRALGGQTPASLVVYSVAGDQVQKRLRLLAQFDEQPSEDDLEDLACVETEIFSDFFDGVSIKTEISIVAPGEELDLLPDGMAYRRPLN